MQFVEEQTGGRVALGAGTLYGALETLSKKGWIALLADEKGSERRKKEYAITDFGRQIAQKEAQRLSELREIAAKIMEDDHGKDGD